VIGKRRGILPLGDRWQTTTGHTKIATFERLVGSEGTLSANRSCPPTNLADTLSNTNRLPAVSEDENLDLDQGLLSTHSR